MGMCASQGRLLLLTGQKSDLELQAQLISNARMTLSRQQEAIATKYSDAISNQELLVRIKNDDGEGYADEEVNYANLLEAGYVVVDAQGNLLDADKISDKGSGEEENTLQWMLMYGGASLVKKDAGGKYLTGEKDENGNAETTENITEAKKLSVAGTSDVTQTYYTGDDAVAKAEYDMEMSKVQSKDKQLELNLDQIETRHKAVETEIESVEKIINKNIEGSFKAFDS